MATRTRIPTEGVTVPKRRSPRPRTMCSCPQCGRQFSARPSDIESGRRFCSPTCSQAGTTRTIADRFWAKVDKSGGPDACWPWLGAKNNAGYGGLMGADGRTYKAHRVAWELAHGPIPSGLDVCHRCDNPACCHAECAVPGCEHLKDSSGCRSHFFLGMDADNVADRTAKGRTSRGEHRPQAKLTEAVVCIIRQRYAAGGVTSTALAQEFRVSKTVIGKALRRETWAHVTEEA